jgi:hypothetical protein
MQHVMRWRPSDISRVGAVLVVAWVAAASLGNETDQFLPPPDGRDLTDVSHLIHIAHYRVMEHAVDRINKSITGALRRGDDAELARLHRPEVLADSVRWRFGQGFKEMMQIEDALRHRLAKQMAGDDELTAWRNPTWIYFMAHMPFDPRNSVLLFQSSTINVGGVYHGVDKWGHFHDLGHIYYKVYRGRVRRGVDHEQAIAATVQDFSRGPISEAAIIGRIATGVQSNADLASNYAGMKFYMNLAEPVRVGDRMLPPLIERRGNYWALAEHVRPEGDFLLPFVTDHWNEALNPSRYEPGMRIAIARRIRANREAILDFYERRQGLDRTRQTYQQLAESLSTFFGEDYGHLPLADHEATIARHCFDEPDEED